MKVHFRNFLPLLLLLAAGIYAQHATAGLVSHWNLDQNSGITATDTGPANNTGTLTNTGIGTVGWTAGKVGSAVALTGNGSSVPSYGGFVTMGHRASLNFNSSNAFSISAWMKAPSGTPQDVTIAGKMIQGTTAEGHYSGYELHYYGGGAFGGGVTAGAVIVWIINDYTVKHIGVRSSNVLINDGNWHHVAFTV